MILIDLLSAIGVLKDNPGLISHKTLHSIHIRTAELDSRKVVSGCLFIGLGGANYDGSTFCEEAINRGASFCLHDNPQKVQVVKDSEFMLYIPQLRQYLPALFATLYGPLHNFLRSAAVTGTNGKTTLMTLTRALFSGEGGGVVAFGTIENQIGNKRTPASLTTPDLATLYNSLKEGVESGCTHWTMEASSHALEQNRLGHLCFDAGVFTNLTQDHLDFHITMENYYQSKKKLFTRHLKPGGYAIIQCQEPWGLRLASELATEAPGVVRVLVNTSLQKIPQDLYASGCPLLQLHAVQMDHQQTKIDFYWGEQLYTITSRLPGRINVENALSLAGLGLALGYTPSSIENVLMHTSVPGRNERFILPTGALALVDYAHTPDALERTLASCREVTKGKLVTVFGCGGDRDRTKRPLMGGIAARLANQVIVTHDNPRTENPMEIIEQIVQGMPAGTDVRIIPDRSSAIRQALSEALTGDCVLIAGKGHENYQIIGKQKHYFSDQEEIQKFCAQQGGTVSLSNKLN